MKIHSPLVLLAALGVLSTAGAAAAAVDTKDWKCESCPYPKGVKGSVEIGIGTVSDASPKFGTYTGLESDGAYGVLGGSVTYRGDSGYFADLSAADLGLDTRRLTAQTGREGTYTLRLGYAELPRYFGEGAATPFLGNGGAVLTLPAGYPASGNTTMPLAGTLQPIELGYKAKRFDLGGTFLAGERWTYRVSLRRDTRDGTKPVFGSFFNTVSQMAAPVDHSNDQLEVAAAYTGRKLQATLAYQVSKFSNGAESLTWSNPFWPVVPGADRGQLALAPDNQLHQIVGSIGYEILPTLRASGDFAYGRLTQDQAFLAPTLTSGLAASVPALPAQSLDGRVDTFNGTVRLAATPMAGLRVNASYTRNERDNRTTRRSYSLLATDIFLDPLQRTSTPFDFIQDLFKLNADWRGPGGLKLSAGAEKDYRDRSYQEVLTTRETTVWGRLGVRAGESLSLSMKLARADRTHSPYGTSVWFGLPENPLLRKYMLAARTRDSAAVRADIVLGEGVGLGIDADVAVDDYTESLVGLTHGRNSGIGADLSAAVSEALSVQVFARGDWMQSRQAGSEQGGGADWLARNKDASSLLGIGLRHAAIPEKLDLGADLVFTRTRAKIAVDAGGLNSAFPDTTSSTDSLKLFANYRLSETMSLNAAFWHERYRSADWHLDGILPATVPSLLALGELSPNYKINVVRVSLRYGF